MTRPRRLAVTAVLPLAILFAGPLAGQTTPAPRPWYVTMSSWGRWGALAGAIAFTGVAIARNRDANVVFRGLTAFCANAQDACVTGDGGRYIDASAEVLYEETLRIDRQARTWMIAGQASLVAAGVMFLIDLVAGDDGPHNIPYAPVEVIAEPRRLGLRVHY